MAGFNLTVFHKKEKEKSNSDALIWSTHMAVPPLLEDDYVEFYKVDHPVIRFKEGVN